jgi:hypothetical protein
MTESRGNQRCGTDRSAGGGCFTLHVTRHIPPASTPARTPDLAPVRTMAAP